ncbi:MAG: ABC transporter permease [Gammaproteobacteria bacterium]
MIRLIAYREFRGLFVLPLAWVLLAVLSFIVAYLFLAQVDGYLRIASRLAAVEGAPGVADLVVAPVLANAAAILLLVMPLLTMRLVAGEESNHSLPLLLSSPVASAQIVMGKFLGVLGFGLIAVLLVCLMPLSLLLGTSLDLGKLLSGMLGLSLLVAAFSAIGLLMSTLSRRPVVAAVSTFGMLLLLWIIDWVGQAAEGAEGVLHYLSLMRHFEPMLRGLVTTGDLAYFLILIGLCLLLSVRVLDNRRVDG